MTNKYNTIQHNNYTNLPQLKKNDKVRLHEEQTWKIKGEIVKRLDEPPRSYLIRTENGNILHRNRNTYYLEKREIVIVFLKTKLMIMSTYLIFMIKQIKLLTTQR